METDRRNRFVLRGTLVLAALWASAAACGDDASTSADAGDDLGPSDGDAAPDSTDTGVPPAWYEPDPEGRTTEGNLLDAEPEMLIVTSTELAAAWRAHATYRTLGGITTQVVTLDEVRAAAAGVDDAETLRNYLRDRRAAGALRFVLLGGDAEFVPFRRVETHVSTPLGDNYSSNGPAELYFGELDTDWDADGDGVWGERDDGLTLEELRGLDVAVGRVPAGEASEVEVYRAKVESYERDDSARGAWPLLLSDVAGTIPGGADIDGGEAIELTVNAYFPEVFKANARRLYATSEAASHYGGEVLTARKTAQALEAGYRLTLHEGHGSWWSLAAELDGDWVRGLTNDVATVFASCACLSGNFADVADEPTFDGWTEQEAGDDSAGELLIVRDHGAVGYLGNVGVGLGPLGGSQFLHAFFQALFEQGITRLGEAFDFGRTHFREVRLTIMMVPFTLADTHEWWTQMILVLLGDPALALWTAESRALALEAPATYGPGFHELTVRVTEAGGAPAAGATVVLLKENDLLLRAATDAEGNAVFRFVPYGPAPIRVRATGTNLVPADATLTPAL